jgi:phenylalanyl-tRNA synthetase beta chain
MRPISNVVDITNYVMHALGSPLHAFDRTRLHEGRIVVRRAAPGEEIRTLDGNLRRLEADDLVIADADRPVAIAGIMGGEDSEVTDETTEVLLEAANFEPVGILRSSERLGLRSEASNRWEKGVDANLAEPAARLASELLVELAGAQWVGERDVRGELSEPPVVRLRPERANHIIGLEIDPGGQRLSLERLGFSVSDAWDVAVPSWRARDVAREIDLIEEIVRLRLEDVPYTLPKRQAMFGRLSESQRLRRLTEDVLVGLGFDEAYTPSLVAEDRDDALRIPEPQSLDQAVLRTAVLPGLIEAARHNLSVGNEGIALFEIARVYLPTSGDLPDEPWHLAGVVQGGFGPAKGAVETTLRALQVSPSFERAEAPLLHPGKTAAFPGGAVGQLRPGLLDGEWGAFEIDLDDLLGRVPGLRAYEDVITYPALRQDLAFAVDEDVSAGDLAAAAKEAAGPELRTMEPFDVYRGDQVGEGRKSIAFRVEFRSPERTLTDEEAAGLRERIVAALRERFGAELRA